MTLDQLRPPSREGLPEIEWGDDPVTPAQLYQHYTAQVAAATVSALQCVAEVERAVTEDVRWAVPDGNRLHGLEYRMKSPGSLAAKIARKAASDPDASPYDVRITDLLRYTLVASAPEGVVTMARDTIRRLKRRGWEMLEAEHSYVPGNPYKGLHTVLRHDQTEVEVQFHSEESVTVKDRMHADYEVMRDPDERLSAQSAAYQAMARVWDRVKSPKGLAELRSLGGVRVQAKTYLNEPQAILDRRATTKMQEGRNSDVFGEG